MSPATRTVETPAGLMRVRRLADLDSGERRQLVTRSAVPDRQIRQAAAAICRSIERGGDRAMAEASTAYGGGRSDPRVRAPEIAAALEDTDGSVLRALEEAIDAVRRHHQTQVPESISHETRPGVRIDRRWTQLHRVGAYIPGGKASYPSSLVMTVVPAQVAGVAEIAVASPCDADGRLDPTLLAAAALLGLDEIYAMGGAQAVAALAFGTETIPGVDKIVGPGNAWVTAAKLEVYGTCAIDLPAGPSEVLVVADRSADPRLVAIDLLCQAEHGPDSPAVLITTDPSLAAKVEAEIAGFLPLLPRRDILGFRAGGSRRNPGDRIPRRGPEFRQRLRPRARLGSHRQRRRGRGEGGQRRLGVRRPLVTRIRRRLRNRRQPRPANRRTGPVARPARSAGLRIVEAGPDPDPRRTGIDQTRYRGTCRRGGPGRPPHGCLGPFRGRVPR